MLRAKPDDAPAGEPCFKVFFGVGEESGAARVPAARESAALDFDKHAGFHQGEVSAPFPRRVEAVFLGDVATAGGFPQKQEMGFRLAHFCWV